MHALKLQVLIKQLSIVITGSHLCPAGNKPGKPANTGSLKRKGLFYSTMSSIVPHHTHAADEQVQGNAKQPKAEQPAPAPAHDIAASRPQPRAGGKKKRVGKIGRQTGPTKDPVNELLHTHGGVRKPERSAKPQSKGKSPAVTKGAAAGKTGKKARPSDDKFESLVNKYRKQIAATTGTARWFDA